jgi:glycosyltransferase involved in cell wall biosynthesis
MGGSVTYVVNFVNALVRLRHSVTVISFSEKEYDFFQHSPLLTHKSFIINKRYYKISVFERFYKLYKYLKIKNYTNFDFVLCDYYLPALAYFLARNFLRGWRRIPVFYQFHGSMAMEHRSQDEYNRKKLVYLYYFVNYTIEKICLSKSERLICFSNYSKSVLKKIFNYSFKAVVVHPGREEQFDIIRKKYTKQQARKRLGISLDKDVIFLATRIEPRKGIAECLSFFYAERVRFPNAIFILATNLRDIPKDLLDLNKMLTYYIHLPNRELLALLYRSADLTLMPSKKLETFGLTTLESFCLGTPVVAYDIGANPELVPQDYLASISRPETFIDVVEKALNKNKVSKENDSLECVRIASNYSWDSYARSLIALVEERSL